MNNIKKFTGARQKVVFDSVLSTYPGGVNVENTDAKLRFTNNVLPAGTVIVSNGSGGWKVLNVALTAPLLATAIGLVLQDIAIEDFTLSSVVTDGTARIDALPDKEKTGIALLKAALPKITFY